MVALNQVVKLTSDSQKWINCLLLTEGRISAISVYQVDMSRKNLPPAGQKGVTLENGVCLMLESGILMPENRAYT